MGYLGMTKSTDHKMMRLEKENAALRQENEVLKEQIKNHLHQIEWLKKVVQGYDEAAPPAG